MLIMLPQKTLAGAIEGSVKAQGLRSPDNIVVYLSKAPAADLDVSKAEFVMDQRNLEFLPHVLPVPVGSTIVFPNNDQVDHNVFSMSRTKKFNLGSYKPGESKTVLFDQPGIVEFKTLQRELDSFEVLLAVDGRFDPATIPRIQQRYRELFGPRINVDCRVVERIPPDPSGKRRYVVSDVALNYAGHELARGPSRDL